MNRNLASSPVRNTPERPGIRRNRGFYRAALLGLTALLLAGGGGCGGEKTSDRSLGSINSVDAMELRGKKKSVLGQARTTVFLDPRPDYEFRHAHITGAINIPFEHLRDRHEELRRPDTIIVYGTGFSGTIATAACKTLLDLGYNDVRLLRGGLQAWESDGLETTRAGQ